MCTPPATGSTFRSSRVGSRRSRRMPWPSTSPPRMARASTPMPFRPVLRGMLFTGEARGFMRSDVPGADPDIPGAWYPLWWPPTKIAGRYLAPYLFERGEEEGLRKPPAGFVDVDIPLAAMTLPG